MTHYLLDSRDPHAIITCNKQELKLYQGNYYYLNNGDNFEIHLFNPMQSKIGAEIIFNGIKKSNRILVINPGQDVILDRFVDEQRKMVYETYEVNGNSESVQKAIENNGLIEIKFYKEKQQVQFRGLPHFTSTPVLNSYSRTYDTHKLKRSASPNYKSATKSFCGSGPEYSDTQSQNINLFQSQTSFDSLSLSDADETIETGRVEKGETSDQYFSEVQVEFETFAFKSVTYKLLPISQKSYDSKEIRLYCTECRFRIRKDSWKFCPKCGNKI